MSSVALQPTGTTARRCLILLGLAVATPLAGVVLAFALMAIFSLKAGDPAGLGAISLVSWALPLAGLGILGWRKRWAGRWLFAGYLVFVGALAWLPFWYMANEDRHAAELSVQGNFRMLQAGMDQWRLEDGPGPIFVPLEKLIGPGRYIHFLKPVRNEEYPFPIRTDWGEVASVTLPDGRVVERTEVLTVVLPWGRAISYPERDDEAGRRIDGVHLLRFADGRRFEVTYRGGWPDGPFRAYRPNGRLWGEANYVHGRPVGPCWRYLDDGRKVDDAASVSAR